MATGTSVLKLVVDDKQYEASLKNARQGMMHLQESLQAAGKTFSDVDGKVIEYARALGQMETVSKTAKGRIGEMSSAFIDLKTQYQQMTDLEKQSPIGQAMAKSLEELKTRTINAKQELADINKELNETGKESEETGGILGQLKDKFTINIDAVKLFNMGLTASKAALDVAKDAFFNNEENLDEWGRTVESVESVYKGFLNSLNTGDISGFLSNIQTITQAARDAYDALDELATFTAFNKANVAGARADLTGAIADYREGNGSKEGVSAASDKLIKELEQKQKLQQEAYQKVIAKVAAERGVRESDLMKVMTGNYGTFKELKDLQYTGRKTTMVATGGTFTSGPTYRQVTEAVPANEREKLAQAIKHLNDTEIDNFQSLAEAAKMTEVEINNQRKMVARVLNGKQGGSSSGGGRSGGGGGTTEPTYAADSIAAQQALVSDLTKKWNEAGEGVRDVYLRSLIDAETKLKSMKDEQALLKEQMQGRLLEDKALEIPVTVSVSDSIAQSIDEIREQLKQNPIVIPIEASTDNVKKLQDTAKTTAKVVGTIGMAFNAIEDPAAKVAATVAQAIANIAMAYSDALAKDTTSKFNIWGFIAASAASMISMATTIEQIHSATGYAQGGIVKGNSYSGDNIGGLVDGSQLVGLNAGEVVLTKAMQGNLASQLQGDGQRSIRIYGKLSGNDIILSADRTLRLQGKELAVWGRG